MSELELFAKVKIVISKLVTIRNQLEVNRLKIVFGTLPFCSSVCLLINRVVAVSLYLISLFSSIDNTYFFACFFENQLSCQCFNL